MNDDRLTETLAVQVLRWKLAPGRFIKTGGGWTPSWRFAPLTNLEQAFDLLDRAASTYTISTKKVGSLQAEVRVGGRVGKASGVAKARTITMALAHALGLELPDEVSTPALTPIHRRGQRSRRRNDGA